MKRLSISLIGLLAISPLAAFVPSPKHDVHVSYCQAEMTATSYKGKVTYYKDDFFKAIAAWAGRDVRGLEAKEAKGIYAGYMESHFRLSGNGGAIPWKWIIKGEDGTSIWFELRAESASAIASATIEHTTLFREYGDQMNLMTLKAPREEYSFIFTTSKPAASVAL